MKSASSTRYTQESRIEYQESLCLASSALYTCQESSTNSPFYAKQTQSCPPPADSKPLIWQGLMKMNHAFRLVKNKPNLSRRSLLAAPKCSTKPGWRSRTKPNLSRRSLLAAAKCSTKPGWRSRIKPNLSRRSLLAPAKSKRSADPRG